MTQEPTPDMLRAAVECVNGPGIYQKGIAPEVLAIEESIYSEVWKAMEAKRTPAAHPAQAQVSDPLADENIEWPDTEGQAHSCLQEALSFGLNWDVIHRHMVSVMFRTAGACRAALRSQGGGNV